MDERPAGRSRYIHAVQQDNERTSAKRRRGERDNAEVESEQAAPHGSSREVDQDLEVMLWQHYGALAGDTGTFLAAHFLAAHFTLAYEVR